MKKTIAWFLIYWLSAFQITYAATYYVTQGGTGDGSTYANAMSVASHNGGSFSPDDIIYLCDTITSEVTPPSDGTSGHEIIYRGDYASHAGVIDRSSSSELVYGIEVDEKAYIKIQNVEITNCGHGIVIRGGVTTGSHYIYVDDCDIHNIGYRGIFTVSDSGTSDRVSQIYVTGSRLWDCGTVFAGMCIMLQRTNYMYVRYNEIYGDTYGVDGFSCEDSKYLYIERNYFHDFDRVPAPYAEDAIDIKKRSEYVYIGENRIENCPAFSGITIQMDSRHARIYRNWINTGDSQGILIKMGTTDYTSQQDMTDIIVWGNIIFGTNSGINLHSNGYGDQGYGIPHVILFNNTLAHNGNMADGVGCGIMLMRGTDHEVKNNIFYRNHGQTDQDASHPYLQIHLDNDVTGEDVDYNYYDHEGTSSDDVIDLDYSYYTFTEYQGMSQEAHGTEGSAGMSAPESNNYELTANLSGVDMGDGSLYQIYAHLPNMSSSDPYDWTNLGTVDMDVVGWTAGAIKYTASSTGPTVGGTSAAIVGGTASAIVGGTQ